MSDAAAVKAVLNLLHFCEQLSTGDGKGPRPVMVNTAVVRNTIQRATTYDANPAADSAALLAAATETVRTLAAENVELYGEVCTLREQVEAQGQTLARTLADHEAVTAELTRQRDSARSIAIRCGAFDSGAGSDYEAHHDRTWPMELVDPEGRLFK